MVQPIYATGVQLTQYTGITISDGARLERLLRRASRTVDTILESASYDVDIVTGLPSDADTADLLAEATAYQAEYFEEKGDLTGAAAGSSGGSIGDVSLPTIAGGSNAGVAASSAAASRLCPETVSLLKSSDLLTWNVRY